MKARRTSEIIPSRVSLKKFEILEMVAKGGMAEVYRAKTVGFSGFEKEVCVKKILPHLTEDESFVNMFINEAKLAATLNYANIVQVHDLCVSAAGDYFIVMEYVHGKDLSDVIRAAQLAGREIPPDIAVYISREVCKGLHYAHTKTDPDGAPLNIIHRDISPHNVLVSFMGEVKITDFGIAKASSIMNKTAVGILKGKYGYMSPEQARGQPLDHRSDIFNTGIVLYELLVGERCFAGSSDFSTLNLMRNAEVTPPTKINVGVPKGLEEIVLRSLSRSREDRFPSSLELERVLAEWARGAAKVATATELTEFMRQLFQSGDERKADASTGVLALSSVVGPPPPPPEPAPAPEPRAPAPPAAEEPPRPARAAKAEAPSNAPPPEAPLPPAPDRDEAEAPRAEEKRKPARERRAEAAAEAPAPAAAPAAPAPAAAAPEAAPKERRPARLVPAKKEAAAKEKAEPKAEKKAKKEAEGPKRPVGRKELRPGLTRMIRLESGQRRRKVIAAAAILSAAALIGAGIGSYRARQVSRQSTFREMELASREGPPKRTVVVLIESDPPGATVRFDNRELSERTPVVVERDRDADAHQIVLSLDRHKTAMRSLKYDSGTVTHFKEKLAGDPGRLQIDTEPSGLLVKIDGEPGGETPFSRDVPFGLRKIEIGGPGRATLSEEVEVAAGKTTRISRKVPKRDAMAELRIRSVPKARIFLGGEATPHWTNEGPLTLATEVDHQITLKPEGGREHPVVVNLKRGEDRTLYLELDEPS